MEIVDEVLVHVFSFIDRWMQLEVRCVNKRFHSLIPSHQILSMDEVLKELAEGGCVETLKLVSQKYFVDDEQRKMMCQSAFDGGQLKLFSYLHNKGEEARCLTAAKNGHLHMFQWMLKNKVKFNHYHVLEGAAAGGHTHIIEWVLSHEEMKLGMSSDYSMGIDAAKNGQIDCIRWMVDKGIACLKGACHEAAEMGDIECVSAFHGPAFSLRP